MVALLLLACKHLTCGEGTHEIDGQCLPDEVVDTDVADTDTDSDTDSDSDADTDSDSDADSDTDADTDIVPPEPVAAFFVFAVGDEDCNGNRAWILGENHATEAPIQLSETTNIGDLAVGAGLEVPVGQLYDFTFGWDGTCGGTHEGGPLHDTPTEDSSYFEIYSDPIHGSTEGWRVGGVDYDTERVQVQFEAGTTTTYAEDIVFTDVGVTSFVQVQVEPPLYIVEADGIDSVRLSILLMSQSRVPFARPDPL